jgi:cytochrome P450 family 13
MRFCVQEIVGQCFVFLLAGYDTTANTLAYLTYNLAMNKSAQKKLSSEIDDFIQTEVGYNQKFSPNTEILHGNTVETS